VPKGEQARAEVLLRMRVPTSNEHANSNGRQAESRA